jgi:hypothetical protein
MGEDRAALRLGEHQRLVSRETGKGEDGEEKPDGGFLVHCRGL